jgi:predicted ester cyclase
LVAGEVFRVAFPDARWTIQELIAEGDRVVSRWTMTGTHAGPLFDLPATGHAVAWTGIDIVRVADGQVAEV